MLIGLTDLSKQVQTCVLVLVLVLVSSRLVTSPHNITRAAGTPKSVRQSTLTLPYIFHIFHIIASKRYQ